ncbi:hypothetical protein R1flu_008319 [Riccia fluitans]|uniref:Uncharacterized protein n=1 Tax=Riccia fluitans TaxID=41844 RepID=A0ABD1YBD1_9MARC
MDSPCPPWPPTQVEEKAGHVKGFVDQMLHDFKIANQERNGLQKRLEEAEKRLKDMEALHAKIGMLEKEKEEMAERMQFIQRPDLYELLTDKLRGHTIRGHPYAIASWENVNLTCTRKNTTFSEDIDKFEANMEDYPELKHALEQNKGLIKYKTDCSVCEGAEVINRDIGKVDTGEAGLHPEEFQGGDNEVDIAARDENKVFLITEVSRALAIANRLAHEALFEQMKAVFDCYVNLTAKADLKPFISELDTLGLDVDRFLGRVPRATSGDEHTSSGEGGSDYIDELGPLIVARLRHEFALLKSQVRGHRPLTRAQARVLSHQAEQAKHFLPEEVTPAKIPMDHVEDIQSPPPDVAS